jgi:chromosome partitioning protein
VAMPTRSIHRQIGQLVGEADAVIDTPPGDLGIVASALRAADLVVVPMQPTTADMDQLAETLSLADDVAAATDLDVLILLTRVVKNTRARSLTREALEEAGHRVLASEVPQSQSLALAHGRPIEDLGPYRDVVAELVEGGVR